MKTTAKAPRTYENLTYRQLQAANKKLLAECGKPHQATLRKLGFKNLGWDNIIALFEKLKSEAVPQEIYTLSAPKKQENIMSESKLTEESKILEEHEIISEYTTKYPSIVTENFNLDLSGLAFLPREQEIDVLESTLINALIKQTNLVKIKNKSHQTLGKLIDQSIANLCWRLQYLYMQGKISKTQLIDYAWLLKSSPYYTKIDWNVWSELSNLTLNQITDRVIVERELNSRSPLH